MAATIGQLGSESATRKIAILGAMKELGAGGEAYHAGLAAPLVAAGVQFALLVGEEMAPLAKALEGRIDFEHVPAHPAATARLKDLIKSEEHTSELQSLMRISYAVFFLKK